MFLEILLAKRYSVQVWFAGNFRGKKGFAKGILVEKRAFYATSLAAKNREYRPVSGVHKVGTHCVRYIASILIDLRV